VETLLSVRRDVIAEAVGRRWHAPLRNEDGDPPGAAIAEAVGRRWHPPLRNNGGDPPGAAIAEALGRRWHPPLRNNGGDPPGAAIAEAVGRQWPPGSATRTATGDPDRRPAGAMIAEAFTAGRHRYSRRTAAGRRRSGSPTRR
jgi:hypothetical protein